MTARFSACFKIRVPAPSNEPGALTFKNRTMKKTIPLFLLTLLAAPLLRAEPAGWAQVPEILARIQAPVFPARDFVITNYGAVAVAGPIVPPPLTGRSTLASKPEAGAS